MVMDGPDEQTKSKLFSSDTLHNLETERLILKAFNKDDPTDYDRVFEMYNQPAILRSLGNQGVDSPEAVEKKRLSRIPDPLYHKGTAPLPNSVWWLLYLKSSGDFVGLVGMNARSKDLPLDPGYSIREQYWHQGFATESAAEVMRFWRQELGVQKMWLGALVNNPASIRVAQKLGFVSGDAFLMVGHDGTTQSFQVMILPGMESFDPRSAFS